MSGIGHNGSPDEIDWSQYGGFIVEARDSRHHHIVGYGKQVRPCEPDRGFCFSVNEAWRDLLHECRYRDGHVMNGGRKMIVERGSLIGAVSWLANRWNWTPMTVRTFLDKLEKDGMISRHVPGASESNKHVGKTAGVISVCNYDKFNPMRDVEQQSKQQTNSKQTANEQQTNNNNIRKNKETRKQDSKEVDSFALAAEAAPGEGQTPLFPEVFLVPKASAPVAPPAVKTEPEPDPAERCFEEFWAAFPPGRKQGKGDARAAFRKIISGQHRIGRRVQAADLLAAVRQYAKTKPDPKYAPMPSTWLNQGRWEDDVCRTTSAAGNLDAATESAMVGPNGRKWGWWLERDYSRLDLAFWRRKLETIKPNGTWPWWELGAPPGHPECIMPAEIVAQYGWEGIYKGQVTHD